MSTTTYLRFTRETLALYGYETANATNKRLLAEGHITKHQYLKAARLIVDTYLTVAR